MLGTVSVNQIFHQRNLASVGDPGVIKPNVDTLYSRVVLDLSKQDVVLTVPNITDGRYWNYPVIDALVVTIISIKAWADHFLDSAISLPRLVLSMVTSLESI